MDKIMEIRNVYKEYKNGDKAFYALNNINADIEKGDFIGIMGPSGAGKSTFLNVVSTIDRPTSGSIRISGSEVTDMGDIEIAEFRKNNLGFIFQEYNLLDNLNARENILLPLVMLHKDIKSYSDRMMKIVHMFEIDRMMDSKPSDMSSGEKQRVAAARAIVTDPAIIMADEPTGALDSGSGRKLLNCLKSINETEHTTIIMVTHDSYAASFCRRNLFIKDGCLVDEITRGEKKEEEYYNEIVHKNACLERNATKNT